MGDSLDEIRQRAIAIYEHYAPEKVHTVDNALARYKGQELELINVLVNKYGPEPAPPSKTQPVSQINTPARTTVGGQENMQATATTQQQLTAQSLQQQQSTFLIPQQQTPTPPPAPDPFKEVKKIINESGFQIHEHERKWEEAWLGKIPRAVITKDIGGEKAVLLDGYGMKFASRPKALGRKWGRRYFVLVPYFLYYFEKDDPDSICKGCLYMDRADITEIDHEDKKVIEISSRVAHKPPQLDATGEYSSFKIYFESPRVQAKWLSVLSEVAKVDASKLLPVNQQQGGGQVTPPAATSDPQLYRQQSSVQQMVSPASNFAPALQQSQPQQSMVFAPSSSPAPHQVIGADGNFQIPITPDDLKTRIRRLTKDRDLQEVNDVLLDCIEKEINGLGQLWHLMDKMEQLETKYAKMNNARSFFPLSQGGGGAQQQQPNMTGSGGTTLLSPPEQSTSPNVFALEQHATAQQYTPGAQQQLLPVSYGGVHPSLPPNANNMDPAQYADLMEMRANQAALQRRIEEQEASMGRIQQAGGNADAAYPQNSGFASASPQRFGVGGLNTSQQQSPAPPAVQLDAAWKDRMDRIKNRKMMVEQMLNDLPSK